MKILYINKFYDLWGGTETVLHGTVERMRARGHEVHVFSTRSPKNLPSDDATRFVERYDFLIQEGLKKDVKKAAAFLWNRDAERAVEEMIHEIRPDVIHLHNLYHHLSSSILAPIRRSRIPCVQTLHDYKLACPNHMMFTEGSPCERCKGGRYYEAVVHHCMNSGFAGNVLGAMEMGMTKLTHAYEKTVRTFICPSQFMADKMVEWGEPASKMTVIPNAIDLPEHRATRDGGYLFVAARLSPEKGLDTLIRAAAQVPELPLKIAGTGPDESRLRMLATSLNATHVEFLGFVRRSERRDIWDRAAALVAPAIWYENNSLSILEAMADGLPILASRIGGIPEQVGHGENGLLVEPGNVAAWVDALREFVHTPEDVRTALAQESRDRVAKTNSWDGHISQLLDVYRRVGASD